MMLPSHPLNDPFSLFDKELTKSYQTHPFQIGITTKKSHGTQEKT
jgi:hypothetical protein